ncbi:lipoate--protein ligase family protein [Longimicrobium terrae]|uniref:Lipoate-protein ligase A n=1 Tax=Longimicrobium terrae TaxID=1639882 RepID=A0A841H6N5_9BACT|nr:lipoate--protein ligase family protein [Longimicrobium terrae]MBB4639357.1 lipoate-protein ligase A [Longimicrobium terrae]MBB6073572.1 lipoate-protein ligase A [Longimicrobium terrae]NNC29420.1 lipoate--protein ligase family protein [Longimicrobium terrae]
MQTNPEPRPAWRLLNTAPAPGAWNMAVDEALADAVRAGGPPTLRLYRWNPACLSLGRNQPGDGYDRDQIRRRGLDVVRRPTGGRAVLHARELTYSVAVRDNVLGSPRHAYAAVNRALVAGLRALGVDAHLQPAGGGRAPLPSLAPCFEQPVEGEVVAGGRKLVGSAQRRERGVILQHGSLILHDDQALLAELMHPGAALPAASPPAALAELMGTVPDWRDLSNAIAGGWRESVGGELVEDTLSAEDEERAAGHRARYEDPAWTWHR